MQITRSLFRLLLPFAALALLGQGCFGGGARQTAQGPDGGVWKTADRGQAWTQKRAYVQGPRVTTGGGNMSVVSMAFDPQDANAIYLATAENGLVFSFDGGDSWQHSPKAAGQQTALLSTGRINAVAVDPKNKCTVYAARANEIFKTETCGRDWTSIFFGARPDKAFTQILADWFNPTILYAGTSDGDLLKSTDSGRNWQIVKRVEDTRINHLVMDPRDSRTIYAATQGDGVWKTQDGGVTWLQIRKQFGEDFREAVRTTQLVIDQKSPNIIYSVSKYGIIKSEDQGETWKGINLTTPPGAVKINALAVDPADSKKIYYASQNSFASSQDGGVSWTVKKLPTSRAASAMLMDPKNTNVIYLGTQPQEKK